MAEPARSAEPGPCLLHIVAHLLEERLDTFEPRHVGAMQAYEASSVIDADPAVIWAVLVDGPKWTEWDSAVVRVDGTIAAGEKVTVFPEVNPKRGFPVRVVEFRPGERMVWRGGMPFGLFTGTRTYTDPWFISGSS